jgi:hypothetical protein
MESQESFRPVLKETTDVGRRGRGRGRSRVLQRLRRMLLARHVQEDDEDVLPPVKRPFYWDVPGDQRFA